MCYCWVHLDFAIKTLNSNDAAGAAQGNGEQAPVFRASRQRERRDALRAFGRDAFGKASFDASIEIARRVKN